MTRELEPRDRLIVALDVDSPAAACHLVEQLKDHVGMFKLGLEAFWAIIASVALEDSSEIAEWQMLFRQVRRRLFVDAKLHDISNTVAGALRAILDMRPVIVNLHAPGGRTMMTAAVRAIADYQEAVNPFPPYSPILAAVTVLTSLGYDDLVEAGFLPPSNIVDAAEEARVKQQRIEDLAIRRLGWLAQDSGCTAIICSPREIATVRQYLQPEMLVITPGVRPTWAVANDQKRVMTPREAIALGADYLVVGRPITNPPVGMKMVEAANTIAVEIELGLADRAAAT